MTMNQLGLFRISKISTFESNSQRIFVWYYKTRRCSEYQRYQLLRAIHNPQNIHHISLSVVPNIKDINFWEQFTTATRLNSSSLMLFRISKISTFESNSQPCVVYVQIPASCSEYQRYQLLRAIHNHDTQRHLTGGVVPNIKDINFWEQFTTAPHVAVQLLELFRISKISTFESNSQQNRRVKIRFSVVPNIKDINFESNSQP